MKDPNAKLRRLIRQSRGDVHHALCRFVGVGTRAGLAEHLGLTRQVVEEAVGPGERGRAYAAARRSIEARLGLTQFLLDEVC